MDWKRSGPSVRFRSLGCPALGLTVLIALCSGGEGEVAFLHGTLACSRFHPIRRFTRPVFRQEPNDLEETTIDALGVNIAAIGLPDVLTDLELVRQSISSRYAVFRQTRAVYRRTLALRAAKRASRAAFCSAASAACRSTFSAA
jgi:hypothetical protein